MNECCLALTPEPYTFCYCIRQKHASHTHVCVCGRKFEGEMKYD